MRSFIIVTMLILGAAQVHAQDDVHELLETGNSFMRSGDFPNAILALHKAWLQDGKNAEVVKALAFCYYLDKDFSNGLSVIQTILNSDSADDACYQIAGDLYVGSAQNKEAEKLYKKAVKRFPDSGPLYSDYGIFLGSLARDNDAIGLWEKGIEVDPSYPGNYYYASKYYYPIDIVRCLFYAEIFVNMESLTTRTTEIKALLMDGYKKLFSDPANFQPREAKKDVVGGSPFENAVRSVWKANAGAVVSGLTAESLTMFKTRCILDWYDKYATQFPVRLFEYERQLIENGMFEAYNRWVYQDAADPSGFQDWVKAHQQQYDAYNDFARGRVFKIPKGQYYPPEGQ